MKMHSKFKLYTIFNGIIHVIFLLNILIYFNNGYVKMQLTEKAEKNGEWIWNFAFITLSFFSSRDRGRQSWWNSKHDLHFEEACAPREWKMSWKNLWNEVMLRAFLHSSYERRKITCDNIFFPWRTLREEKHFMGFSVKRL